MRFSIFVGLAGLAILGAPAACSNPAGPELTQIVVTVDWPVAREPGFAEARWQLIEYDPDDWLPRGPVVASGVIGSDGVFTVRYSARCTDGTFESTGHRIEVSGHFSAHERSWLPECATWAPHRCSSIHQTVGLSADPPFEECRPPVTGRNRRIPLRKYARRFSEQIQFGDHNGMVRTRLE